MHFHYTGVVLRVFIYTVLCAYVAIIAALA